MLEIEVDLACRDWEEIPTDNIAEVAAEARKQAGEFMPTNGLMAKIWRELQGNRFDEAQKAIRAENTARYLAPPGASLPTDDEREKIAAQMAAIADRLIKEST